MCLQCMTTAMTAGAAATGSRAWLAQHRPRWMRDRHLAWITRGLLASALLASAVALGGAG